MHHGRVHDRLSLQDGPLFRRASRMERNNWPLGNESLGEVVGEEGIYHRPSSENFSMNLFAKIFK